MFNVNCVQTTLRPIMSQDTSEDKDKKPYAPRRPFPLHTLEQALAVAKALQDKNAGKPLKPFLLAEALAIKPTSSGFRDITSSSWKYGLTTGTWNADYIGLTTLGSTITKPIGREQETKALQQAVLNIEAFGKVYDFYRNNKLPSSNDNYFKNKLESDFGIPRIQVEEFIQFLIDNGKFTGILRESQGSLYVDFAETIPEQTKPEEEEPEEASPETPPTPAAPAQAPPQQPCPPVVNQIFVIHGKNRVPLDQLKKILDEPFKIKYKVALDEANVGRPISQKVADLMKACTSAIVIFTADEEYTDGKGNKVYRPSDNAVYELGAASVLYDNKIVILKEEGVTLSSDFSDLGHITFEKDRLDSKTSDLIREFIGFGLLKVVTA
jgi:hypothetical protein